MYLVQSLRTFLGTNAERTGAGLAAFLPGDEYIETDTGDKYIHNGMGWRLDSSSPGGSDTQVQFNDSGVFGGSSGLTFDKTNVYLGVGTGSPAAKLHVNEPAAATPLEVRYSSQSDSLAQTLVRQSFYAKNSAAQDVEYARISVGIEDANDTTEDGSYSIERVLNGTLVPVFSMGSTSSEIANDTISLTGTTVQVGTGGYIATFGSSEIAFNELGANRDFRVESQSNSAAFFVDASANQVIVGKSTPNTTFTDPALVVDNGNLPAVFRRDGTTVIGNNQFYNADTTNGNGLLLVMSSDTTGAGATAGHGFMQLRGVFDEHDHATATASLSFRIRRNGVFSDRLTIGSGVQIGSPSSGDPGSGALSLDAYLNLDEMSSTPSSPTAGSECNIYMKSDKLIIQYNQGGTVRYKYLDLTGTGVTWTHTTTAP